MRLTAAVMLLWYCDSSTTYTIFMTGRPRTSSGTTRRFAALLAVKPPIGPPPIAGAVDLVVGSVTTILSADDEEEAARATLSCAPAIDDDVWSAPNRGVLGCQLF
jgi:hypothetical protein